MSENKGLIIIQTIRDRLITRFGTIFYPPKKNRFVLESPIQSIKSLLNVEEDQINTYRNPIFVEDIIRVIEDNVKNRMPKARYEKIMDFSKNKEWIDILESIYILLRIKKPEVVIETGIGEIGMSTTFMLQALNENRLGHLYSVDPDKFYHIYGYHVGTGIPDNLKVRHTVVVGNSQDKLEDLLKKVNRVDVFLHDGDHRYKTKTFEYESALRHLNNDGFILSDDTFDSSVDRFIARHNMHGVSVRHGNSFFSYTRK